MNTAAIYTRLAQAKGCDRPVSARVPCPKTSESGEWASRVAAVAGDGSDTSTRETLQRRQACGGVG